MKAHVPDVARAIPPFNVESIEAGAEDALDRVAAHGRRVEFESIAFNERFLATVAPGHDPIAVREMFSPSFLDWAAGIDDEVDFGVSERQLYFLWRLRELSREEYEEALRNAGELLRRVVAEVAENGLHTYELGPWHAGLEPFPDVPGG